jgi:hypothetical protein
VASERSLFRVRGAERGRGDEKLGFGWINVLYFHVRLMIWSYIHSNSKVIDLAGFGSQIGRGTQFGESLEGGLPGCTHATIPRIRREEKIRFAVDCADPGAIETNLGCDRAEIEGVVALLHVLEHIDEGLARFRLRGRVMFLIGLHIKIDLVRAATSSGAGRSHVVLRKDRGCEKENCEQGFHHASKTWFGAKWFRVRRPGR